MVRSLGRLDCGRVLSFDEESRRRKFVEASISTSPGRKQSVALLPSIPCRSVSSVTDVRLARCPFQAQASHHLDNLISFLADLAS